MIHSVDAPLEMVTNDLQLVNAIEIAMHEVQVALDTEGNSFFRYPERLCLIQIATSKHLWVIDPLEISDLTPLKKLLAEPTVTKLAHGSDYDIRAFDRDWGYHFQGLYDTTIAARFAGINRFGLGPLVEDLLGINLVKEKRLQRADWSLRPLSPESLEYAAGDVRHLMALRDVLDKKLISLNRLTWVSEECKRMESIRHSPPDPEKAFLSIKGSGVLDPKGLSIFRELVLFRDLHARKRGIPPFRILPDAALIYLAGHPESELQEAPGLNSLGVRRFGRGLKKAIEVGIKSPPFYRPKTNQPRPSNEEADRLKKLKKWRVEQAEKMELDQSLIWPMASLERLARIPIIDEEIFATEIRNWQREELETSLRACLLDL